MKYLFILIFTISSYAIDYEVYCPYQYQESDWFTFTTNIRIPNWIESCGYNSSVGMTVCYGDGGLTEDYFYYWDNSSPICGGNGTSNKLIESFCNPSTNSTCWYMGISGGTVVTSQTDAYFTNNITIVNNKPCLSAGTAGFSYIAENDETGSFETSSSGLTSHEVYATYSLTTDEAQTQRSLCTESSSNTNSNTVDYTEQLNQIITNTAFNEVTSNAVTDINNRQSQIENDLENSTNGKSIESMLDTTSETDTFNSTFQTTLSDTYDSYLDPFGLGGYGTAPAPITFTFGSTSYTLFDVTTIGTENVTLIRNIFLIFAYIFGFIIVFRTT